ncbi:hypothetical protein [Ancylobacter lacus]|uniref:hypothetical protein n=1 Tax=Ancylobacter lacus TaxID=2579970 RepID=UPI001BCACEDE|nr:hypothetical protein [Ancylobacter lacus]MBS7541492.1 hypothetical protein [Ancylobacter lacus]
MAKEPRGADDRASENAGDPSGADELRVFTAAHLIKRDHQRFAPGDTITLTEIEHGPLHRAGAVAEPWDAAAEGEG